MKYQIGLKVGSKYGFGDVKSLIKKGISWGINFFEITTTDIKDIEFYKNLKKQKINFGIHVPHAYTPDNPMALCATLSPYKERAIKWFKKSIKIAQELNAKYIIVHPDLSQIPKGNSRYPEGIKFARNRKEGFNQFIENIKKYHQEIPLLIEVMPSPNYYNFNLKESLKLHNIIKTNFCFDVDHAFEVDQKINPVIHWYQGIKKYVEIFHVCDFDPEIRGHLPIGEGKINFNKFFQKIKLNNNQIFILEVLPNSIKSTEKDLIGSKNKLEQWLKN